MKSHNYESFNNKSRNNDTRGDDATMQASIEKCHYNDMSRNNDSVLTEAYHNYEISLYSGHQPICPPHTSHYWAYYQGKFYVVLLIKFPERNWAY